MAEICAPNAWLLAAMLILVFSAGVSAGLLVAIGLRTKFSRVDNDG